MTLPEIRAALDAHTEHGCMASHAELWKWVEYLLPHAERYAWLRTHPNFMGWEHDFMPNQVDAAIDQARKP